MSSKGWSDLLASQSQLSHNIGRYDVLRCDPSRLGAFRVTQTVVGERLVRHEDLTKQVLSPRDGETILIRDRESGDTWAYKAARTRVTFEPVRL